MMNKKLDANEKISTKHILESHFKQVHWTLTIGKNGNTFM